MDFITADKNRLETGFLTSVQKLDIDIGDTNDFVIFMDLDDWKRKPYDFGDLFFAPDTEYGGIIEDRNIDTKSNSIDLSGLTFRGLLSQKIIEPPKGKDYLEVSGEANEVLKNLVGNRFGDLFAVSEKNSGIKVSYQFERYGEMLSEFQKMLTAAGARLSICYKQGEGAGAGKVYMEAVPVKDWSEELEYSRENRISFSVRDCRRGINHLICLGKGELSARQVAHLYLQEDGSVRYDKPFYTGFHERTAVYDGGNADDLTTLRNEGKNELKKLTAYQEMSLSIENINVELGDIVGGKEEVTGMVMKKPIIQKIIRVENNTETFEYKVGD